MRRIALALVVVLALVLPGLAVESRSGLEYGNSEPYNKNVDIIGGRLPLTPGGGASNSAIFCGQLANAGTIYLGPANVADATGENGEGANAQASAGGTVCNALDSATEATADAPLYTNLRVRVTGMYCKAVADAGTTGSGTNGAVFTLRSAAADTAPVLTCTVPTTGIECQATPATANIPVIAAGATMAVKAVSTEDLSAMDGWCRVFYSVNQ